MADYLIKGRPAVFVTDFSANKKSIYAVTIDGRLAQIWDTNRWNVDFPAEAAGQTALRFQNSPAVFSTNFAANKKSIYAVTVDGRLAQIWDNGGWHLDFPAESAGQSTLKFQDGVAVFPTNAAANKKSIYAVTVDGRLAQIWDNGGWHLDFPAESAGQSALKFQGVPAVFPTNAAANKKSIYAVTVDGRLAQIWDNGGWHLDFPAESAGQSALKFQHGVAVFPTDAAANKKFIYAVTADGRLARLWDFDGPWKVEFPAEDAVRESLRFEGIPSICVIEVFARHSAPILDTYVQVITWDGRLAHVWNSGRWNLDFPAELAGQNGLRFHGSSAAPGGNQDIYAVSGNGDLTQLWVDSGWHLDFPVQAA